MNITPELIKSIQYDLQMGLDCYLHRETLEVVVLPNDLKNPDYDEENWAESRAKVKADAKKYILIEPISTFDSFRFMEKFTRMVDNVVVQRKLFAALDRKKPFRGFRNVLNDHDQYLQEWYTYRDAKEQEHVATLLSLRGRDEEE